MAEQATYLFLNARVFTANAGRPTAQTVAVQGNRIVHVGSESESIAFRSPTTQIVDCQQKTLLPGFIDSHFHLLQGSLHLDGMQLEGAKTYTALETAMQDYAFSHAERLWLDGYGLRYNLGPGSSPLTRQTLDSIISNRPIVLFAYDFHTAWGNTLALQLAGIMNGGECGPNSEIMVDERGQATGELREHGAFDHVRDLLPLPDDHRKRALLHEGLKLIAAAGVTSVHNMDGDKVKASLYAALEDTGELTCRVYLPYSVTPQTPFQALRQEAVALRDHFHSNMVRGGSVKFFMDGVIESYTGLLVDAYADRPDTKGAANYTPDHFNLFATEADRLGLQICVHACGDGAVRQVLDGYQAAQKANGWRDSRHRVEHIEVIHPNDIARFHELGVIASMQPLHSPLALGDGDVWPTRVGPSRWPLSFAWQTVREAGAHMVFGSDWPVVTYNPLLGVDAALNRKLWAGGLPDQTQTLENTLLAYTRNAAWAEFREETKGQIREGYLADLVLLSEDIFATPKETIGSVRPLLTMCDGRIVYQA